jgi:SAM-dependent methyltransferase
MNLSRYQCPNCQKSHWRTSSILWSCEACGHEYPCVSGIPRLYVESALGEQDKALRDRLYDGFLGTYYQYVMPFLSLPARPAREYWQGWLVYVLLMVSLVGVVGYLVSTASLLIALVLFAVVGAFFFKHPYVFYLLLLAVPVKVSLRLKRFRPAQSFQEIHADVLGDFLKREERLQVLDISTGTCNSLYRHGWMRLDADYTGLDLSETMMLQGQKFMSDRQIPMEFVLADAARPPFQSDTFDLVLNYGAVNGFTDPRRALEEMARVTRKGGFLLFFDEQLYEGATFVERWYFKTVLSSHNRIHRCPVELLPAGLRDVRLHQVYPFYYLCTAYKA